MLYSNFYTSPQARRRHTTGRQLSSLVGAFIPFNCGGTYSAERSSRNMQSRCDIQATAQILLRKIPYSPSRQRHGPPARVPGNAFIQQPIMSHQNPLFPVLTARLRQELASQPAPSPQPLAVPDPAPVHEAAPPPSSVLGRVGCWLRRYRGVPAELDGVRRTLEELRRTLDRTLEEHDRLLADLRRSQDIQLARLGRLEADLRFEHRRLARLADSQGAPSEPSPARPPSLAIPGLRDLPAEDRQSLAQRLSVHLERVKTWPSLGPSHPLLDIGCKTGEWLALLNAAGIEAYGVDIDPHAVAEAQGRGVNAQVAEGIEHLSALPDGSLGAVSALRLVEYLPIEQVALLIAEARRALIAGGRLVIETPNASSLLVTARTFLQDPRRNRPIPADVLRRLLQSQGFRVDDGVAVREPASSDDAWADQMEAFFVRGARCHDDRLQVVMADISVGAAGIPAVHQFHGSSSVGDAITNGLLYTRKLLQGFGIQSNIYCEDVEPRLAARILPVATFPDDPETVLLLHYSWTIRSFSWLRTLKCRKVLVFHNITPSEFFEPESAFARLSALAYQQLRELRTIVDRCLVPSAFNARELCRLGFGNIEVLPLLFDSDGWQRRPHDGIPPVPLDEECFHILFVGRIVEHKRQEDLLFVLSRLRRLLQRSVHLTLVGGAGGDGAYLVRLRQICAELDLEDCVTFAGKLADAELHALYRSAHVFLCLSEHEGFCVPLLEAMQSDLPVVAYASSAVAETVGQGGLVLRDKGPDHVAGILKILADEPGLRRKLTIAGRENMQRFHRASTQRRLACYLRSHFAVKIPVTATPAQAEKFWRIEGPFDSSYSLALVNRSLAQALRKADVDVGLFSTEGPGDFEPDERFLATNPQIRALWQRGSAGDDPDVVLRNLYPPRVTGMNAPTRLLASWGWEESGIPIQWIDRFNRELNLVTVFSRFVAKVLIDNGLRVPVAVVGNGAEHLGDGPSPMAPPANSRFTFLSISSGFPRKGIDVLLQAWARTFTQADKVRLVIKTFPNPHNDVAKQIDELRLTVQDLAEIDHISADLDRDQLALLYDDCDAVVMPSRGEGFGLPAIEAMIREIPVIATGHGGMVDFCSEKTAWLVDYRFARARSHFDLFDSVWAEPDVESLGASLRTVQRASSAERRLRTTAARRQVETVFTWPAVAERTKKALAWLESRPSIGLLPKVAWVTSWNTRCGIAAYARHLACAIPRGQLHVFASHTGEPLEQDELFVQRCWQQGQDDRLEELYAAIRRSGATSAVLQFNFSFYNLESFGRLIDRLAEKGVVCHVVLHSTLDVDWLDRHLSLGEIRDSLARARRLLVHTVADLNVMKAFGLVDNVALLPHGSATLPPSIRTVAKGRWG